MAFPPFGRVRPVPIPRRALCRSCAPWRDSVRTICRRVRRGNLPTATGRNRPASDLPTVTPTGAPVRRPNLPPTGSDGFGNRSPWRLCSRQNQTPSRFIKPHQTKRGIVSGTVTATGNRPPLRLCSRQIKPRQGLSNLIKRNAGLFSEGSATGNRPTARAARCGNKRNPAASRFPSRFHAKQSREFVPRPAIIPPAFRLSRVYSPRRLLPPADSRLISPIPA